jgi:hypothetical protein
MYYAAGILGLVGELRPAPLFNTADINEGTVDFTWTFASDAFCAACIAVEPAAFGTAVTVNGTASSDNVGANAVLTFSHTVASGSNTVLFVGIINTLGTINTVTFNGDAMTVIDNTNVTSGAVETAWYYRVAPDVATGNVVVTCAAAEDIAAVAIALDNVSQTSPFLPVSSADGAQTHSSAAGTSATVKPTGSTDGMALAMLGTDDQNPAGDQTEVAEENVAASLYMNAQRASFVAGENHFQYFLEEPATSSSTTPFLYATRQRTDGVKGVYTRKVILSNTAFGTVHPGGHIVNTAQLLAGQPARYRGKWYLPAHGAVKPVELTTVGTGDVSTDTISTVGAASSVGGDHLANLGHQLVISKESGGVSILKVDGTVTTDADWGSFFSVGDKEERAVGLSGLAGLAFVLNKEGLFSFNKAGRSGMIWEDFRRWRTTFKNVAVTAYKGGLLIPHPSGLQYYTPGQVPVNVGLDKFAVQAALPASNVTELHGGRYHGIAVAGDFVYAIYQPDISSTTALVACGFPTSQYPTSLVWQVLGTTTLQSTDYMAGCGVALDSHPDSASYVTPTVWFGNGADLNWALLDSRAGPFRSRVQTHKVNTSGDAFMPEILFPTPVKLSHLVVYTEDMASGDEWQLSGIINSGADKNYGATVKANGREERKAEEVNVHRFTLHVNWTATSSSARVPPTIRRIELWGWPE